MNGHTQQTAQDVITNSPGLLSSEQTAQYLNISTRTLANWRCIGRPHLRHTRVGRSIRYYKEALDAYLVRNTVSGSEGQ